MVTRPAHQADAFCQMIESAGGYAIRLPVLEIADPQNLQSTLTQFKHLNEFDVAIFISPNAVRKAVDLLSEHNLSLPKELKLAAIGPSTASALQRSGYRLDLVPPNTFTSEALLALDELRALSGQDMLIIRGEGGRELLADTLRSRGARVEYAEVYRRTRPRIDHKTLETAFLSSEIDLITLSSVEGLHNLIELARQAGVSEVTQYRLLVGSERIRSAALRLGFTKLIVADDPGDLAMFRAIKNWVREQNRF